MATHTPDPYARLAYRGLISWPDRLRRELPLIQRVLASAPSNRVLDLGCGSGEHTRFLKALGFDVTGVDVSAAQVAAAQAEDPEGRYVQVGLTDLGDGVEADQGAALCVGNTLPHLCEEAEVRTFFSGLAGRLQRGAPFLLQLLNYDRILDRGERTFPVVLRPGEVDGEDTVFLRLMTHHGGGRLTFTPANLRYHPGGAPSLELIAAHDVPLRGWRRAEVEALAQETGWNVREVIGTMTGDAWTPTSSDLVLVLERA